MVKGNIILVSDCLAEDGLAILRANGGVTANPKIDIEELMVSNTEFDAVIVRSRTKVT